MIPRHMRGESILAGTKLATELTVEACTTQMLCLYVFAQVTATPGLVPTLLTTPHN